MDLGDHLATWYGYDGQTLRVTHDMMYDDALVRGVCEHFFIDDCARPWGSECVTEVNSTSIGDGQRVVSLPHMFDLVVRIELPVGAHAVRMVDPMGRAVESPDLDELALPMRAYIYSPIDVVYAVPAEAVDAPVRIYGVIMREDARRLMYDATTVTRVGSDGWWLARGGTGGACDTAHVLATHADHAREPPKRPTGPRTLRVDIPCNVCNRLAYEACFSKPADATGAYARRSAS